MGLDLIKPHWVPEDIQVDYTNSTGAIQVAIDKLDAKTERIVIHSHSGLGGNIDPPHPFIPDHEPLITCDPSELTFGKEAIFEIAISPFMIHDTSRLTRVIISTGVTVIDENRVFLSSTPPATSKPTEYSIEWLYPEPPSRFTRHSARWRVRVPDDPDGGVLFRTGVGAFYDKPIYVSSQPTFIVTDASKIRFRDEGSRYSYGYEHMLS
jgi:hypothetical protein